VAKSVAKDTRAKRGSLIKGPQIGLQVKMGGCRLGQKLRVGKRADARVGRGGGWGKEKKNSSSTDKGVLVLGLGKKKGNRRGTTWVAMW